MSKIKVYLDTSTLYQIFNGEFDIIKLIKFECITSIQAIMELCVSGGVEKNAEEIALFLSNFCKIRSIDYDVFTKFNSVYPSFNQNPALILHFSIAMLEGCEYFVSEDKITINTSLKIIKLSELTENQIEKNQTPSLFDLL